MPSLRAQLNNLVGLIEKYEAVKREAVIRQEYTLEEYELGVLEAHGDSVLQSLKAEGDVFEALQLVAELMPMNIGITHRDIRFERVKYLVRYERIDDGS